MKTIALFGGSFDPPHLGHKAVVDAILSTLDVDEVVVMPAYLNPFKSKVYASGSLRFQWLQKIFSSYAFLLNCSYVSNGFCESAREE